MNEQELLQRTKHFALRTLRVSEALPQSFAARHIGGQLLRAGTSVGANYRAACRARSRADMAAKLAIVEEEADECIFWMEMLIEAEVLPASRLADLLREANEILAITVASRKTLRARDAHNRKSKI